MRSSATSTISSRGYDALYSSRQARGSRKLEHSYGDATRRLHRTTYGRLHPELGQRARSPSSRAYAGATPGVRSPAPHHVSLRRRLARACSRCDAQANERSRGPLGPTSYRTSDTDHRFGRSVDPRPTHEHPVTIGYSCYSFLGGRCSMSRRGNVRPAEIPGLAEALLP